MKNKNKNWIFIHLGARAHYQFPEAVTDSLNTLYTDIWIPENFLTQLLSCIPIPLLRKLLQRNNKNIEDRKVVAFPISLFIHEALWKLKGIEGWEKIIKRNKWFQKKVMAHLNKNTPEGPVTLFTFAYTALEPLKLAQKRGWQSLIYQMDPGLEEEEIVRKELTTSSSINTSWKPAPSSYWKEWKEEIALANKIIVNSTWSKSALLKVNAPEEKIVVMPLGLEANIESISYTKNYPDRFTSERPLKVLFLGILTLRKGLRAVLEAIELLKDHPIEFTFVGPPETEISINSKIRLVQSVSRSETAIFYKEADVFLFPTLSDGFGLTQLEAFQWKLPIIASKFCGEVVQDNKNGIILQEVSAKQISEALLKCLGDISMLTEFSKNTSARVKDFSLNDLGRDLIKISN